MNDPLWDAFNWDDGTLWDGGQASAWIEEPQASGLWADEPMAAGVWTEEPEIT